MHISSGVAALAAAHILGRRVTAAGESVQQPHSLMLVLLGTGLLWFGWFGFNGGSALAADGIAVIALVNTNVAAAAGALAWLLLSWHRRTNPACWARPRAPSPAWWPSRPPPVSSSRCRP